MRKTVTHSVSNATCRETKTVNGQAPAKKVAMHAPHYIKFTRVPDIRKCTFGEGKDQKTFKEVFGRDFDSLKEEEQDRIRKRSSRCIVKEIRYAILNTRSKDKPSR